MSPRSIHSSTAGWLADRCAAESRAHVLHVRALIDGGDVAALSTAANFATACRILLARLPRAGGLNNVSTSPVGLLYAADALTLPLRIAQSLGVLKADASASSLAQTFRRISNATGPAADAVRAILTGKGEPAAAVMLRRIIEARRGAALPTFELSA